MCSVAGKNQCPPELAGNVLYLKVPWPRFEKTGDPTAMTMSNNSNVDLEDTVISTKDSLFKYVLQDVSFRIDTVKYNRQGDTSDYLLKNLQQEGDTTTVTIRSGGSTMQLQGAGFWLGLNFQVKGSELVLC